MNAYKSKLITDYIDKINKLLEENNPILNNTNDFYDLFAEIINVMQDDIPRMQDSILFKPQTISRDANTIIGLLKMYLANNGIQYKEKEKQENISLKTFWKSFIFWFENELINLEWLNEKYLGYDTWDGGRLFLDMDYDYEFKLYRGINYPDSLKNNKCKIEDIKMFIEIAYKYWIKNDAKIHYEFTIEVNERLRIFKLPYKLQCGILLKQGYKTTFPIDKIVNYRMFERKIRFSEDMINGTDLMEKKSALDFLIDALQYFISIQEGKNKKGQYKSLAKSVNDDENSKAYAVINQEINEIMKLSNEYFDIRHNENLNSSKQAREALNDPQFIEYLYNRAYALLYILRLKEQNNN